MHFRLVLKSTTLDDLTKKESIQSAAKCRPMTVDSGTVRDMEYSCGFLDEGASDNTGVVEISDFSATSALGFLPRDAL